MPNRSLADELSDRVIHRRAYGRGPDEIAVSVSDFRHLLAVVRAAEAVAARPKFRACVARLEAISAIPTVPAGHEVVVLPSAVVDIAESLLESLEGSDGDDPSAATVRHVLSLALARAVMAARKGTGA